MYRKPADMTAAYELYLYADNNGRLYNSMLKSMHENLNRKAKRGTYDREKAVKLFTYAATEAAKLYEKDFLRPGEWNQVFTPATRTAAAEMLRDSFEGLYNI